MVDSAQRSPLFPDVPTIPQATRRAFPAMSYFSLVAPPGTPKPLVARLQAEIAPIAALPEFRDRNFVQRGLEPVVSTPDEFARFLKNDRAVSEQIVRESGLQP